MWWMIGVLIFLAGCNASLTTSYTPPRRTKTYPYYPLPPQRPQQQPPSQQQWTQVEYETRCQQAAYKFIINLDPSMNEDDVRRLWKSVVVMEYGLNKENDLNAVQRHFLNHPLNPNHLSIREYSYQKMGKLPPERRSQQAAYVPPPPPQPQPPPVPPQIDGTRLDAKQITETASKAFNALHPQAPKQVNLRDLKDALLALRWTDDDSYRQVNNFYNGYKKERRIVNNITLLQDAEDTCMGHGGRTRLVGCDMIDDQHEILKILQAKFQAVESRPANLRGLPLPSKKEETPPKKKEEPPPKKREPAPQPVQTNNDADFDPLAYATEGKGK